MSVLLETSLGDIVIDTYCDEAPEASLNFIKLCKIKYFNDCEFFCIESGFVARTGDPQNNGSGGTAIYAQCQPKGSALIGGYSSAALSHTRKGVASFAASNTQTSTGLPTFGSQFFITLTEGLDYLDMDGHTVFGIVAEGMKTIDLLAGTPVNELNCPFRVIRIRHTIVLDDPFADPPGMPVICSSPEPAQTVPADRLGSDGDSDIEGGFSAGEVAHLTKLEEEQAEREARSRAEVLEMVGDIGDANLKPPDNVLFICKLNPVTDAEGLEIIFSRFGKCHADVIKDRQTGESLCYAFVEFETKEQCEKAYFKMDNALIDDRTVHVDFSQSVSKLWNDAHKEKRRKSKSNPGAVSGNGRNKIVRHSNLQYRIRPFRESIKRSEIKSDDLSGHAKRRKTRFDVQ